MRRKTDVLFNIGDGGIAHTGGSEWEDPMISTALRRFVSNDGGLIGVGEPSGHQYQGCYLRLSSLLGVEKKNDLSKAQVGVVINLAKALGCEVEDLID